MATRFYFPTTGTPAITPAYDPGWDYTDQADRMEMVTSKISSSFATKQDTETDGSAVYLLLRQYISAAQYQAFSFSSAYTWAHVFRGLENGKNANMEIGYRIKVISGDGSTVRGVLSDFNHGFVEFDYKALESVYRGTVNCLSVSMQDGDRILIEVGIYAGNADATSYTGTVEFGDNSGSDLPASSGDANQYCSWLELSADLTEYVPTSAWTPKVIIF